MKNTISAFWSLALVLGASAAGAQQIPEISFDEFYLDNGLRVIVHEDRKAPIVAVTIWYHVGSKNELPGKTGFAHLFEHLMFNGTENYNDDYFKPFQEVGATSMNGTTNVDRTNYFQTVPSTAVDLALWMESDRMGHLLGAIDQDKLEEQRGVVQNEKRQGENQPYGKAFQEILANVFPPDHPYSWPVIGSMEDLNAASLDDVREWFENYYGPDNATLVLAGDIDVTTAKAKVQQYFGHIPPGPPLTKRDDWTLGELEEKRVIMQDRVPQARVYKTWRAPQWRSDDSTLLDLAGEVLSGSKTSRLYQRLVYKDEIATDVGASAWAAEIAGAFIVSATVAPGQDIAEVERALDEELARFLADGPTDEELARVKTEIRAFVIRGLERVGGFRGKSNILAENAVYGGRPDFYKQSLAVLQSATAEDVRLAANRWITGNAVTLEIHPYPQSLAASGEDADRVSPPITREFPAASFPKLGRATLSNGMRLIVAERNAVPVVQFSLQMNAGYAADQFGKPGTAKLAMEMLDEGTMSMDALEIADALAGLGATLRTGSNLDYSFASLSSLKENLDEALAIYADVILNPEFPDSELERLRRLQLAAIEQEKTTPDSMAFRVFPKLVYGEGHAYSLPLTGSGTEASVSAISRDDVFDFHATWFKPNSATMIVAGDITLEEIQSRLEAAFAEWQPGETPQKNLPQVDPPAGPRVFLLDRPDSEQSVIIAGHLIPERRVGEEIALDAMNDILGGNFTSRINMNLREDKGWSYGARTTLYDTQAQRPYFAYAPVQTDQTAAAMLEIAREIDEFLANRPPSDEEVETSKKRSTLTLPGRWETAGSVAGSIAELVRFDLPDDYWDRYSGLVASLDTAAVRDAASDVLAPDRLTWVVVGDLEVIGADVRALGFGEVQLLDSEGNIVSAR
ncbi:M16 family metallopeptidase [Candidatus Rariloculus sp.]|uniref:M16 family metallopeptidase n=1 Tax=Candidatus Rariloculus sp. TaxID=3101265 RepID=UPI003D0C2A9E